MRINEIVYVIFDESNRKNFLGKIKTMLDSRAIVENYDKYYDCWQDSEVSKENLRKIN